MTLSNYLGLFYKPYKNYTSVKTYVSVYVDGEWVHKDKEFTHKGEDLNVLCKDYMDYDVEVFHVLDNDIFIATSSERYGYDREKQRNITIKLKKHKSRKELEEEINYLRDIIGASYDKRFK